jgi:mycofactocin precursor
LHGCHRRVAPQTRTLARTRSFGLPPQRPATNSAITSRQLRLVKSVERQQRITQGRDEGDLGVDGAEQLAQLVQVLIECAPADRGTACSGEQVDGVVDRRRPTRAAGGGDTAIASIAALDAIFCRLDRDLSSRYTRKGHAPMEPNQQSEAETELVTETLVEEVSIDGMCGVY